VATIGEGDLEFEILMPTGDGRIDRRLVSIAQQVVSFIVEMDDAARAVRDPTGPDPIDFDEVLAYVVIRHAAIEFHYFATTVNTEWSIYFTPNAQGSWARRGLQRP
jgi:hypothetical protein